MRLAMPAKELVRMTDILLLRIRVRARDRRPMPALAALIAPADNVASNRKDAWLCNISGLRS